MLLVKTNSVYRLRRNFSMQRQLVKNARVGRERHRAPDDNSTVHLSKELGCHTNDDEDDTLVPCICFSHVLSLGHTLISHQFPLAPSYSTTFHGSERLTLHIVRVDLTRPVFTHVRHRSYSKIRVGEGENSTTNVTFHEMLLFP